MKDEAQPKNISRRKFIKGVGAGVVGSSVLMSTLEAETHKESEISIENLERTELLSLKVNGQKVRVHVEARTTLAELIRDRLQLSGTKIVCNQGECGSCTVLLDGKAVYSCHTLALDAMDKEVTTIEGLLSGEKLHPTQAAFHEKDGYQCGFCTPGQVMAAQALLLKNANPNREQIIKGMSGNLCRCGAYPNIIASVEAAAKTATS